jgi:TP901 family phage tail tape measure protein
MKPQLEDLKAGETMEKGVLKLAPLMTEIKVDISNFKSDMEKAGAIGSSEARKISKELETTTKIGESLSKTGSLLTKGLTLPLIGAGTATTKMAVDFESSFAKVSTLLDDNVVDFDQYKEQLLDASSESKVAVDEFSESVYESISAGVDQTKAIGFTTEAIKLAKGGFTDGAKAVDVLTTAINGYNLKTEDATRISDLLITTQNLGKTTVDELASSMGAVIPVAASVNFDITELSASYAQLTKNGIATAESGTYLKAMLSELGKSGTTTDLALRELTGKGFADLKKEGTSTSEILSMLTQYAAENDKTLKDMFGSVEAGSAALVLAKGSGQEYNDMLSAMSDSAGATQSAFEKIDAAPAEQLKGALNELRNEGVRLGAMFVPVIEKTADIVGDAADAFSNLSDEQQDNIIKWGMVLAATGPALKVVGGGVTTFTKLSSVIGGVSKGLKTFGTAQTAAATAAKGASAIIGHAGLTGSMVGLLGTLAPVAAGAAVVGTGIYAIHENSQLMNRSVIDAKEDLSLMEEMLAKLNGTEVRTKEELEKLNLITKDYGDTLSEEFVNNMDKSREKMVDFNTYLTSISLDGVISAEESNELISRVESMCNETIATIQAKKDEAQKNLRELFIAEDGVIDESEQQVLNTLSESYDAQQQAVQEHLNAINAIKQAAAEQNNQLTEAQIQELSQHYEKVAQIQLQANAETKEELLAAEKDFQNQIATMNADQASELLKKKAKERDEEIKLVKEKYDDGISQLKLYMETADETEKQMYQKQIDNLEASKEKAIQTEQDKYEKYYNMALDSNKNLEGVINKYNGKILTNQEIENKKILDEMKAAYDGIGSITKSGCYYMYNTVAGRYEQVAIKVDEKTGDIVAMHSNLSHKTGSAWKEIGESAEKMAQKEDAAFQLVAGSHIKYDETSNMVIDSATGIKYALEEVTEATDGTREGILNINGTPYNITVNKDGTIAALEEIEAKADSIVGSPRVIEFVPQYLSAGDRIGLQLGKFHYNGLDNVPYDGYQAVLHKGERVLTAEENQAYERNAEIDYRKMEQCMRSAVKELSLKFGERQIGRVIDQRLRERGILI